MEKQPIPSVENFYEPDLRQALATGDGEAVLAAVEQAPLNPVLESIGLRLQLRDFWSSRKGDLAQTLHHATGEQFDTTISGMIHTMDRALMHLTGTSAEAETMPTAQELAAARQGRLVAELQGRDPASRLELMQRYGQMPATEFKSPQQLLAVTTERRNEVVERLWRPVDLLRRGGEGGAAQASEELSRQVAVLNSDFDHLIGSALALPPLPNKNESEA